MSHSPKTNNSMTVALIMTLVGGFLDAYTYMLRGGTFANAQTGNIVMTGVNIALGKPHEAMAHFLAIMAFVVGILCAVFISKCFKSVRLVTWQSFILMVETVVLIVVGFVPDIPQYDNFVVIIISFITSMQYAAFKQTRDITYATTMCTGMLRSATELLYKIIERKGGEQEKFNCLVLYIIILTFCIGCAIGTLCCKFIGIKAIWICAAVMLIISVVLVYEKQENIFSKKDKLSIN